MSILIAGSCATPALPDATLPPPGDTSRGLVIIAHGVDASADGWPLRMEESFRYLDAPIEQWDFYRVEWRGASRDRLAAPRIGYGLGRRIGEQLAGPEFDYEVVHLVGHSAGAHVIHGIADVQAACAPGDTNCGDSRPVVFATFLDPFVARSIVQLYWGVRRFGGNTSYAENYFTRKDSVPFTNSPLDHAHNVDLTPILPPRDDAASNYAHLWPIEFYLNGRDGKNPGIRRSPMALLGDTVTRSDARALSTRLAARYPRGETSEPGDADRSAILNLSN